MEALGLYGVSVRFAEIILFRYPRRSQCMHQLNDSGPPGVSSFLVCRNPNTDTFFSYLNHVNHMFARIKKYVVIRYIQ